MDLYEVRNQLNAGRTIYDLPLKVTFYARVSTDKYEQANSLKNQMDYFENMIKTNEHWQYIPGYIDEGLSGTSVHKRDAFLKMIRDAKQKKFDFIITKEISRFSRNTLDSIQFTQQLLSYGVGILFQADTINTLYPDAELRLTIMSSIAQEEVRKISERVKFGLKRSIENGRVLGNNAIWGYSKQDGRLVIDQDEAEIIKLIYTLYTGEKMGIRQIAKQLETRGYLNHEGNCFSFSTLKNILSNPKYKGYYCGNKTKIVDYRLKNKIAIQKEDWVVYKDDVNIPAIIDEEMWEQANRILNERSTKAKNNETAYQSRYTYSGKLFCAQHGTSFHRALYRYKDGNKEIWQCKQYREKGKTACDSPTLYTTELDIIMKNAFESYLGDRMSLVRRMTQRYKTALHNTDLLNEPIKKQKELDKILQKKEKLLELSLEGKLSNEEFYERNEKLNLDIQTIQTIISKQKIEQDGILQNIQSIDPLWERITQKANLLDQEGVGEIVTRAVEKIVVFQTSDKDSLKLQIVWKGNQTFECINSRKQLKQQFTSLRTTPYIS